MRLVFAIEKAVNSKIAVCGLTAFSITIPIFGTFVISSQVQALKSAFTYLSFHPLVAYPLLTSYHWVIEVRQMLDKSFACRLTGTHGSFKTILLDAKGYKKVYTKKPF